MGKFLGEDYINRKSKQFDLKGYACDHTRVERLSKEEADKSYKDLMKWIDENHSIKNRWWSKHWWG